MGGKFMPVRIYVFVLHRSRRISLLLLVKANDSMILCRLSFKFRSEMINLEIQVVPLRYGQFISIIFVLWK